MSEDLTRDPLLGKLARLRPTSAGIDRDEILFACGRASAPRVRVWKLAAAVLAFSQVALVGIWLGILRPERGPSQAAVNRVEPTDVSPAPTPDSEPLAADSYGRLVQRWDRDELSPPPAMADPAPSVPVLSVRGSRQFLNVD